MSDIVWEDPPQALRGRGRHGAVPEFLAELVKHPGKWALYPSPGSQGHVRGVAAKMGLQIEMRHIHQKTPEQRLYIRVVEP